MAKKKVPEPAPVAKPEPVEEKVETKEQKIPAVKKEENPETEENHTGKILEMHKNGMPSVEIAKALGVYKEGMTQQEAADAACAEIDNLSRMVGIPAHLSELGITEKDIDALADQAILDVCTPGNPREVTREDIVNIYRQIL